MIENCISDLVHNIYYILANLSLANMTSIVE